jgi:DNA-binding LytR/AlgR family response regulator
MIDKKQLWHQQGGEHMIKVAVVEDDVAYQQQLLEYLERYEAEQGEHFQTVVFSDGDEIVENYRADYDLILMDIQMQFMDGMQAAEQIRKRDKDVIIIFITNLSSYAMRGYQVDALDYVLKPITYFAFSERIDRALSRRRNRMTAYLSIPVKGGIRRIDVSDIVYIEVHDHDLIYHMTHETFETRGSMKAAEEMLESYPFFRCNKFYLVNLQYVEAVSGSEVLLKRETLTVSRAKRKELLDALNNYLSESAK